MDISIAIVTYNSAGEIAACMASVVRDLGKALGQVVLVDNASTDGTIDAVKKEVNRHEDAYCRFEVVQNKKNVGFTRALNQVLTRCRGRYILVLNPDTELLSPCLSILMDALEQDNSIGVVAPQLLNSDGTIQKSCRRFPRRRDLLFEVSGLSYIFSESSRFNRWKMGSFEHRVRSFVEQPQGAFLFFRRSLLQEVGPWDERFPMFFSDVDWCKRVIKKEYQILFEPTARALHHKGVSISRNRAAMIWTSHRSFYHYFKKHTRNIVLENEFFGLILLLAGFARIAVYYVARILGSFGK